MGRRERWLSIYIICSIYILFDPPLPLMGDTCGVYVSQVSSYSKVILTRVSFVLILISVLGDLYMNILVRRTHAKFEFLPQRQPDVALCRGAALVLVVPLRRRPKLCALETGERETIHVRLSYMVSYSMCVQFSIFYDYSVLIVFKSCENLCSPLDIFSPQVDVFL